MRGGSRPDHRRTHQTLRDDLARWQWQQSIERTRKQRDKEAYNLGYNQGGRDALPHNDDEAYNRGYNQGWVDALSRKSGREQWSQTPLKLYSEIGIQSGPGESSVSTSAGARPKARNVRSLPY